MSQIGIESNGKVEVEDEEKEQIKRTVDYINTP